MPQSPEHRIERFITRSDDPDACWGWIGAAQPFGYGRISTMRNGVRISELAHRVAYRKYIGPVPDGLCVCHRCDNPGCTNPRHLFVGTMLDNNRDAAVKGRRPKGEGHYHVRYTDEQVAAVRQLAAEGVPRAIIAARFGMNTSVISKYVLGYERRNGKPRPPLVGRAGERNGRAKLTLSQVADIRRLLAQGGVYQKDIARQFGVSACMISAIATGKRWREASDVAA